MSEKEPQYDDVESNESHVGRDIKLDRATVEIIASAIDKFTGLKSVVSVERDNGSEISTPEHVAELMASSESEEEWNNNADKVKEAFGGNYPNFWYPTIIMSGIAGSTAAKWKK